jgi:hypothetical protein
VLKFPKPRHSSPRESSKAAAFAAAVDKPRTQVAGVIETTTPKYYLLKSQKFLQDNQTNCVYNMSDQLPQERDNPNGLQD